MGRWTTARLTVRNGWDAARILDQLAEQDAEHPEVRELAGMLASSSSSPGRVVHEWVQQNVAFVREPGEVFQAAHYTIAVRAGDCDDHARLVKALALAAGVPCRLAFLELGEQPAHVFPELYIDHTWQAAETTIAAELGEHPLDAAKRLGIVTRPDLAGSTVRLGRGGQLAIGDLAADELDLVPVKLGLDSPDIAQSAQSPGWIAPPSRTSTGWQSDPGRTMWAANLFRRLLPNQPEQVIHAALAVSAIETGIGRYLGNNFGGIMSRNQVPGNPPASSPPPVAACPPGSILGTDVTQQDGVKRWVCFDNPPTPQEGARRFLAELVRHTPRELASGDASRIAAEMYATHYYAGLTPSATTEIARYASAIEGAAVIVSRHLGTSPLVTRPSLLSTVAGVALGAGALIVLAQYGGE